MSIIFADYSCEYISELICLKVERLVYLTAPLIVRVFVLHDLTIPSLSYCIQNAYLTGEREVISRAY